MLHNNKTIAVLDDHPIVLQGLMRLLSEEGSFTVNGFTEGTSLLVFLQSNRPDMILLDIGLPDISGIELFGQIKALVPDTLILAFSNHSERSAVIQMLDKGADGYLLKSTQPEEIIRCIGIAFEGRLALSPEVEQIVESEKRIPPGSGIVRLSAREKEILTMIAAGATSSQIAKKLFLSKFTVDNHRKNLLQKLKAKNVAELISEAVRQKQI